MPGQPWTTSRLCLRLTQTAWASWAFPWAGQWQQPYQAGISGSPPAPFGLLWLISARPSFPRLQARSSKRENQTWIWGNVVSREFLLQCQKAKPHLELARRRLPLLIVHGTEDKTVPVFHADLFHRAAESSGSPVELHKISGADHTYARRDWEEKVLAISSSWLCATTAVNV